MKRSEMLKAAVCIVAGLFLAMPVRAQFLDSSVGVSAGLVKLFGNFTGFSAQTDVQVLDSNRQETLRTPMNIALLDGKVRMEFEMSQMRGKSVQPAVVNGMKQMGMDRVASVIRIDKRITHIFFPKVQGCVDLDITPAEAEAAEKNVQVQRTPLGKEVVDKHPCTKNRVVVKSAKGASLMEATTWNAEDMKDFPVQIAVQAKEGTTILRFTKIQMTRPAAALFDVPAGFTKFTSAEALMLAATQRQLTGSKPAAPAKNTVNAPVASTSTAATGPAKKTTRPAPAAGSVVKTNATRSVSKPATTKR
ncbi:MAG TPA: hypothetical protein VK327_10410 [Candidatus Paceibacterota bacterium]|nr:hypothetical protein [Candidatus Paceibacterota bacterium]